MKKRPDKLQVNN